MATPLFQNIANAIQYKVSQNIVTNNIDLKNNIVNIVMDIYKLLYTIRPDLMMIMPKIDEILQILRVIYMNNEGKINDIIVKIIVDIINPIGMQLNNRIRTEYPQLFEQQVATRIIEELKCYASGGYEPSGEVNSGSSVVKKSGDDIGRIAYCNNGNWVFGEIPPKPKQCFANSEWTPSGNINSGSTINRISGDCKGQEAMCNSSGHWEFGPCDPKQNPIRFVGQQEYKQLCNKLGKCLDIPNGNPANGVSVNQWDRNGGPGQLWRLQDGRLCNKLGKCLDTPNGSPDNGVGMHQWDANDGLGQSWAFKNGHLCNKLGKCLTVPMNNPSNGIQMVQSDATGANGQLWEFS